MTHRIPYRSALTALPLAVLLACSNPADGKPAASVGDPASPAPPAADAPPSSDSATPLRFSPADSSIQMVGSKVTGSHDVKVTDFSGDIHLGQDAPLESGRVKVVMRMASIEADHPKLTSHLKNGDFFAVDQHPTSTFESTAISKGGEGNATHTVTGNLTLRGTTKQIRFPATITRDGAAVRVNAEFSINRQDFGVAYAGKPDDLIRDEVLIKLNLSAN